MCALTVGSRRKHEDRTIAGLSVEANRQAARQAGKEARRQGGKEARRQAGILSAIQTARRPLTPPALFSHPHYEAVPKTHSVSVIGSVHVFQSSHIYCSFFGNFTLRHTKYFLYASAIKRAHTSCRNLQQE